ncbi:hypothetical protein [Shewanella algae]|uniref:hypothetical protein n=1 Tax=Shewanella algae TaxID=38313 RepID=UPI0039997122
MLRFSKAWIDLQSPVSPRFDRGGIAITFSQPWQNLTSPVEIRFGGGTPPDPGPDIPEPSLGADIAIRWIHNQQTEQQLQLPMVGPHTTAKLALSWQSPTTIADRLQVYWSQGRQHGIEVLANWQSKDALQHSTAVTWRLPVPLQMAAGIRWLNPAAWQAIWQLGWKALSSVYLPQPIAWAFGIECYGETEISYSHEDQRGAEPAIAWGPHRGVWICSDAYMPPEPGPITIRFSEPWQDNQSPVSLKFKPNPRHCYWDDGGGLIDANPVQPPLDLKVPIEPQIRRLYLMQPTLTCHRLSDNRELVITECSITDSRSQFVTSGSIKFSSKVDALLAVDEVLRIGINGYEFYLLAEAPSSSEAWASNSYTSAARGRASQLAWPWKREISYHNQAARSFAGCLSDIVANSGWSIELVQVPDFVIPAGVCSVSGKTPLDAVAELAGLVGCMVDPDEDNSKLRILPRWTYTPWSMAAAIPDVLLHDAVIFNHSEQTERGQQCNVAWVRGEQQGVSVEVRLNGTAGDEPTDDISNMLIVDTQAARLAGTNAIADSGTKRRVSINTTVMADLPPLRPGQLIGVTWRGEVYKALCDTVTISASMSSSGLTVRQNAGLIRQGA